MKYRRIVVLTGLLAVLFTGGASASTVVAAWDLFNKSPGYLGPNYGLRLNGLDINGDSNAIMIFDFEKSGYDVGLQLVSVGTGTGLEMHLTGTAYGAVFDDVTDSYSGVNAGSYDLNFIWRNVSQNVGVYEFLAEATLGSMQVGSGTGSVLGTAFSTLLYDWSGTYQYTLDIDYSANPDASGWLTYDNVSGGHSGDFGFSMLSVPIPQVVPAPAPIALFGLGFIALGVVLKRKRIIS